jgi:hypothetical protein
MLLLSCKALRWVAIYGTTAAIIIMIGMFKGLGFIIGLTAAKALISSPWYLIDFFIIN